MTQTLNEFINKVGNYGIARNNKFEIILPKQLDAVTSGYSDAVLNDTKDLATFYAESVQIPGKVINTTKTKIQGKNLERPSEFLYDSTLNATFLVDTRLQIRKYFDDWFNIVYPNGSSTSFSPNLPEAYRHKMQINVIDYVSDNTGKTKEIISGKYTFYDVYPKYVSGVSLTQNGKDFQRVTVVFEFDYYESEYVENNPYIQAKPPLIKASAPRPENRANGTVESSPTPIAVSNAIGIIKSRLNGVLGI